MSEKGGSWFFGIILILAGGLLIVEAILSFLNFGSILGILDIVKQESIELERATRQTIHKERPEPNEE